MLFEPFDPNSDHSEFRRNLPHWRQGSSTYFVTWRLADSLPPEKLRAWLAERERWLRARGLTSPSDVQKLPPKEVHEFENDFGTRMEEWLDAGHGSCCLADAVVAKVVEGALRHFDGERYALGEFVVMPNHVHVLVTPAPDWELSKLLHSWKSFTAKEVNKLLGREGTLWQDESFNHIVRSDAQLRHLERYIRENPGKARLATGRYMCGRGKAFAEIGSAVRVGSVEHRLEACATLSRLKIRHFRCFEQFEAEFAQGTNFIVGPNARGKTSLLEAACILLRLQSPRISQLARVVQHGRRGFVTDGYFGGRHLQFYYSQEKKKLSLDGVEQANAREWLGIGRVVWFGNDDIELVRGAADKRRRFLDFAGVQCDAGYRTSQRAFEHALRSRNHLLKQPSQRWREIAAFDQPLIEHGNYISTARRNLIAELQADADAAHFAISGQRESLRLEYVPGDLGNFSASLASAKAEDGRLRQTTVGPHRDDVRFFFNGLPADDASEGQQRTLVLALKLGAARLLERRFGAAPLLLLDDIFGELDPARRNALLAALPADAQRIITTTHLDWMQDAGAAHVLRLER